MKSPPVMVGHSFGGLIVQSYISNMEDAFSSNQSSLPGIYAANAIHFLVASSDLFSQ